MCEVMAQQTQVARVVERWRPFLDRFPTPAASPRSPPPKVVAVVVGPRVQPPRARPAPRGPGGGAASTAAVLPTTSMPSRAAGHRSVHRTRRAGVRLRGRPRDRRHQHGGCSPAGPGVASGQGGAGGRRRGRPGREAWAWNQAMLDLGATLPAARPACGRCPGRRLLSWAIAGRPSPDPADGSAGVSGWPVALRGQRPSGRGRLVGPCAPGPVRRPRRGDGLADDPVGRSGWRRRSSTTASRRPPTAATASRGPGEEVHDQPVHLVRLLEVEEVAQHPRRSPAVTPRT